MSKFQNQSESTTLRLTVLSSISKDRAEEGQNGFKHICFFVDD